jgi:DNA-directed RNA polymerase specialized sigma24 family protein
MRAYRDGDDAAFRELYRRYAPRVYGFLSGRMQNRTEASDVFQSTWLRLHRYRDRFDPTFLFQPWLFTIARNTLMDHFRKTKASPAEELHENELTGGTGPVGSVSDLPELDRLEPTQREALRLRYKEDLPFDEIAKRLQTSPVNVRQIVSRAIRKLRRSA